MKAQPLVTAQSLLQRPTIPNLQRQGADVLQPATSREPEQIKASAPATPRKRRRIALDNGYVDPAGWEQLVRQRTGQR